jgi:multicomponent Na+:H+ antiporter subunit E
MKLLRAVILFGLLLAFWLLLSGRLDPLFVVLGVLAAAAVTWLSLPLLEVVLGRAEVTPRVHLGWLVVYVLWLVGRIIPAGVQVARVVLDPRMPPQPGVVSFRTTLATPAARTTLANSITLVPGTMTLEVDGDRFIVHAFTPQAVADLATAAVQCRIARVYRLEPDEPPVLRWEPATASPEEDG